ncbi:MAG: hypothetical protein FJ098_17265, partial [Deltaproteobacteria bacterium]|nr:hypothetical protein [Deltaproteobacteria bacterium]
MMPPLGPGLLHPEVGLPQLCAYLRREGLAVSMLDLNALFIARHAFAAAVVEASLAGASPRALHRLVARLAGLRRRRARLDGNLAAPGEPLSPSRREILVALVMDTMALSLPPLPDAGEDGPGAPAVDPVEARRHLEEGLEDPTLAQSVRALWLDFLETDWFAPTGWQPREIARAAGAACPGLDRFLELFLAPHLAKRPALLGLSIHGSSHLVPALRIAAWARDRAPGIHVTLGGPWCAAARDLLRTDSVVVSRVDSVVTGEGELPLAGLVRAIREGENVSRIPGLLLPREGGVLDTGPARELSLEELPPPDFGDVDWSLYPQRTVSFRTVRGCTWGRCLFCYHILPDGEHPGGTTAPRMQEDHLAALLHLLRDAKARHGVDVLTLADTATPPSVLRQIADALLREGISVGWSALARFDPAFDAPLFRLLH